MGHFLENLFSYTRGAEWFINFIFQSSVISGLGYLAIRLMKHRSAPLRSSTSLTVILLLLILPVISGLVQVFDISAVRSPFPFSNADLNNEALSPEAVTAAGMQTSSAKTLRISDSLDGSTKTSVKEKRLFVGTTVEKVIISAGLIWFLGFVFHLVRLAAGFILVSRFKRRVLEADPFAHPYVAALEGFRKLFPGVPLPGLYTSTEIETPMVLGIFKPRLVLPAHLPESLSVAQLKSVFVHELSHVYHRDHLAGLLQKIVKALHWWNPAVNTLNRCFSHAREDISDNYALLQNDVGDYARCLIGIAEKAVVAKQVPVFVGMAASHIPLKERVKNILSKERIMDTKLKRPAAVTIILLSVMVLGFIIAHSWTIGKEKIVSPLSINDNPTISQYRYLKGLFNRKDKTLKVLKSILSALPENVDIYLLEVGDEGFIVEVSTYNNSSTALFIDNLKLSKYFHNITYHGSAQLKGGLTKHKIEGRYKSDIIDDSIKLPFPEKFTGTEEQIKKASKELNLLKLNLHNFSSVRPFMRELQQIFMDEKILFLRFTSQNSLREMPGYTTVPYKVLINANIDNLTGLITKISRMNKLVLLTDLKVKQRSKANIKLKPGPNLEVRFKLTIYVKRAK